MKIIKRRQCSRCGKKTFRIKYCTACALLAQQEQIEESNKKARELAVDKKAEKKYMNHFMKDFAWDNPNDLGLGI